MADYDNFAVKSDLKEAIESAETIESYTSLCKLKNFFEDCIFEVSNGSIFFSARKNRYITIFDVILSNGVKISEITCEGNHDNVPKEIQEAFAESYISEVGKLIAVLDEKIRLAEIKEKKSERRTNLLCAWTFTAISACIIAIFFMTIQS